MTTSRNHPCGKSHDRERGSTLLVGMLILTIMALLGLSAAVIGKSDERMARNSRDRNVAFFAAEAALRDARLDIRSPGSRISGKSGADPACDVVQGFCTKATIAGDPQAWEVPLTSAMIDPTRSVAIGEITGKAKFSMGEGYSGSVSQQPRYVIEVLTGATAQAGWGLGVNDPTQYLYRITAIGFGTNAGTRVLLQEVIRK